MKFLECDEYVMWLSNGVSFEKSGYFFRLFLCIFVYFLSFWMLLMECFCLGEIKFI